MYYFQDIYHSVLFFVYFFNIVLNSMIFNENK